MIALLSGSTGRLRRRAAALLLIAAGNSAGCALVPTWDDIHTAKETVTDTVTGKARRDRQKQTFAEARILERRKDFAAAEHLYRELLKEEPQSRDCYHRLAVMASLQGKFDDAAALYQSAVDCGRPTADLMSDMGYCYYLQHQLPQAEQALKKAIELEPKHRAALNNLAMVIGEAGNLEEAYRLLRQGNPEAEAEANFAYLCAQCGDLERAQKHYSQALSHDPELRVAVEGLLQVTQRMQFELDRADTQRQATEGQTQNGDVQTVAYDQPIDAPPRRQLIEVYTAMPPRPGTADKTAANAGTVGTSAAASASPPSGQGPTQPFQPSSAAAPNNNAAAAPPAQPSFGFSQPQPVGQVPGTNVNASRPYSFPAQAQPQYLQPTTQLNPGGSNGNAGGENAAGGARSGDLLSAGGPFPPLVGGASAVR